VVASTKVEHDEAKHSLGIGTTHAMTSVVTGVFMPSWQWREYTLGENVNLWRGRAVSRGCGLWNDLLATDLTQNLTALGLPVYFLRGAFDYTVSLEDVLAGTNALADPVVNEASLK
jgi:hypothetical protein